MKAYTIITIILTVVFFSQLSAQDETPDAIEFSPVKHGTMVIETSDVSIYVDPAGDVKAFEQFPSPDIILITDIHGDHLDAEAVNALKEDKTVIVAPKAVAERLGEGQILNNGESKMVQKVTIEAIPMYNISEGRLQYHEKGRGNGYVITAAKKRIYISGDTEDIPEMRGLKDIDYAFVCMNLPYTMTVEQAASAVLEMKPKVVFPYHYRGSDGFSDVEKFKQLVSENENIEVRLLNWYN
jgi:L-ascorbate metabolism protein UlaG (beta-lactamase superfamily)